MAATAEIEAFDRWVRPVLQIVFPEKAEAILNFRAAQAHLLKIKELSNAYQNAAKDLKDAKNRILKGREVRQKEQLQPLKAVVQRFLEANDAFKNYMKQGDENFQRQLAKENVSAPAIDKEVAAYRDSSAEQTPLLLEIRKQDNRMGETMMSVLNLLEADWGQWQYDAAEDKLKFRDAESLRKYNVLIGEINAAGEDQHAAQQKLAPVMSRQSARK